jgi:RNA polymerase sigma-70 factor (ECF subfamily)
MQRAVEEAFRDQWGRLLALLVARYRRLDLAEDGLADAFEAAARHWAVDGPPDSPGAWLLTAARRRILDRLRAEAVAARKEPMLVVDESLRQEVQSTMADPGGLLSDERLRLVLLCAHPSLAPESASALSLRLVLGVPTAEVARLFLVSEATMAARLTRAKRKLAATGVPFAMAEGAALADRLEVVASVIYLAFTTGYAPSTGEDVLRVETAGEAIRLARVVRDLAGPQPAIDALLALMLLQHSRRNARVSASRIVLLPDQDRSRWQHDEIVEALALLEPLLLSEPSGPARAYFLQALIAAEHAVAPTAGETHWERIEAHYEALEAHTQSPVVRLNRAVAAAELMGPDAGLALLEGLEEQLPRNHRLYAVRGELLDRAGHPAAAMAAYQLAIDLCTNDPERSYLTERLASIS